jgi:N-methylhydantoinase A
LIIGIDTGGTFTDFVVIDENGIRVHKEPSTPENPAHAVIAGYRHLIGSAHANVVHGSTVATNALLERKGARVILITTAGFEDVLEIGRQTRRVIYDINVTKQPPLVPADRRLGISERLSETGAVLSAPSEEQLSAVVEEAMALDGDAVAICLLHSYANPAHEQKLEEAVAARFKGFITSSHDVLPEFREYERTSTTVVNAFVGPVMSKYLSDLGDGLGVDNVRIMQSNGGVISLDTAQRHAVHTVLSGPAGGAVGGFELGRRAGFDHLITFDMGGTSTDVSLMPGALLRTSESGIGDLPIRVPVIDIHTVGAGGGSVAYRDPGGSLRVGPESAGAVPGPICYDRGGERLTVTDANLFLGHLSPAHFLGGKTQLPREGVVIAMEVFADTLGISPTDAAEGIVRVANATMERAIRVISLERGFDPRDFSLLCFGGAGGMHAVDLAKSLGIPRVVVPRAAGILSALGMLLADFVRDYSRTLLVAADGSSDVDVERAFEELESRARVEAKVEGIDADRLRLERNYDARYLGQGYELSVSGELGVVAGFHQAHEQRYGYADPQRVVEIVNVRVRATAEAEHPSLPVGEVGDEDSAHAVVSHQPMTFDGMTAEAPIVDRDRLLPGNRLDGPALLVEYSTTTVVPPDYTATVDAFFNVILEAS